MSECAWSSSACLRAEEARRSQSPVRFREGLARRVSGVAASGLFWIVVLALSIYLARSRRLMKLPQFWAEDATVFFHASLADALAAVVQPYAGYLHLGPRTVAAFGALVPGTLAPTAMYWGACAAAVFCSGAIYRLAASLQNPYRFLIALAPLGALPGPEIYGNATNTQWFFGTLLGVLVVCYRRDRFPSPWWLVLGGYLSLTGPFSVILFPIFLCWAALHREIRINRAMLLVVGAGATVQLLILMLMGANKYGEGIAALPSWMAAVEQLLRRFTSLRVWPLSLLLMSVVVFLPMLASWSARRGRGQERDTFLPVAFLALSLATLAAGVATHKHQPDLLSPVGGGARYFLEPYAFVLMALLASHRAGRRWGWLALILVIVLLIGWRKHLNVPAQPNLHWASYYRLSMLADDVVAPILPNWEMPLYRPETSTKDGVRTIPVESGAADQTGQLMFSIPGACAERRERFVRVSVEEAAEVKLAMVDGLDRNVVRAAAGHIIGPGGHWYFPVSESRPSDIIRIDLPGGPLPTIGLGLSWVCFN